MNLSGIDLNLFRVLHAVLKEKSATRAARSLNLTQSAVSNALVRLRTLLDDPVVVRNGRGMLPTPRATELFPLVESAMSQLQSALDRQSPVDPAQVTRCFTLGCSDSSQTHDVCRIVQALACRMPRASLRVVSQEHLIASNGLETGEVDAMLGMRRAARGLHSVPLYQDDAVLIVRRDRGRFPKRLSRKALGSLQHIDTMIAMDPSGRTRKPYPPFVARDGLTRRVVLTVPSFTAAALVVARTDYAAVVPRRVATALSDCLPLKIFEFPFQGFTPDVALIWHSRTDKDRAARHFRETIINALR